jgi:hypothetical protein
MVFLSGGVDYLLERRTGPGVRVTGSIYEYIRCAPKTERRMLSLSSMTACRLRRATVNVPAVRPPGVRSGAPQFAGTLWGGFEYPRSLGHLKPYQVAVSFIILVTISACLVSPRTRSPPHNLTIGC